MGITPGSFKNKDASEVFADFIKAHGDRYDYSKVVYVSGKDKVCIICRKHGEFWQAPSGHRSGKGCIKCAVENKCQGQDAFLKKAKEIHGDAYDYSKAVYTKNTDKICIICKIHGEFWQTPLGHLTGRGCRKCAVVKRAQINTKSVEDFVENAKRVHGDKFDYSKVAYKKVNEKVCISCKEHGDFWQTPLSHKQGCGCPKCGSGLKSLKMTASREEFIDKAKGVHGEGTYDYSKVEYVGHKIKICIVCPIHGDFKQTPRDHLLGRKCRKCAHDTLIKSLILTRDEFLSKAIQVHGDKYDYSKAVYVDSHKKVILICKIHGEFEKSPNSHLRGEGCQECGWDITSKKLVRTVEDFIGKAVKRHGEGTYDYSRVEYVDVVTPVCIVCPSHGEFYQIPHSHTQGHGCPNCQKSKGELAIRRWLDGEDINFIQEHKFSDLRGPGNRHLKFDFYLPDDNLLIEFDGGHHFKPVCFGGISEKRALECFKSTQINDALKEEYCRSKEIPLLRISYKELKRIPDILFDKIINRCIAA